MLEASRARPAQYQLVGCTVDSMVPLPPLAPHAGLSTAADITISDVDVPPMLEQFDLEGAAYKAAVGVFWLELANIATYRATKDHIQVWRHSNGTAQLVSNPILGKLMAAVHALRGNLALRGSTVQIDGRRVVICGQPGVGKTTIATALVQRGALLVSDDLTVVKPTAAGTEVLMGPPIVRLWPDSAAALSIDISKCPRLVPDAEKRYVSVPGEMGSAGATDLVVFAMESQAEPALSRVDAALAVASLRNTVHSMPYAKALGQQRSMLANIANLMNTCDTWALSWRRSGNSISRLADIVTELAQT